MRHAERRGLTAAVGQLDSRTQIAPNQLEQLSASSGNGSGAGERNDRWRNQNPCRLSRPEIGIGTLESSGIWWYLNLMSVLEQALGLPRPEKLRLMEALWTDLSLVEEELDSPKWHEAALRETEARVAAGEEQQVDWDEAKRLLRRRP